ncbi:tyrosine-type recombinase/integrase [Actinomadura montaniterrae]|uniref:Tyrosine-type recombinase/integrase n=1 Tax=Actinomadura montaniterrae TaxID=1803903 RepID=A0A6L3VYU6_9ACTN|nr:tyrosine-type recombinase/integrase [Actinomadura montaniterrae]KAB2378149.1 tyrosine-type recombinase/integrase [Actinomadura montaniterrae]
MTSNDAANDAVNGSPTSAVAEEAAVTAVQRAASGPTVPVSSERSEETGEPLEGVVLAPADPESTGAATRGTQGSPGSGVAADAAPPVVADARSLAHPAAPLAADALAKLDADLGQVQVARIGGRRIYRRRIELLAEACTPRTFALVLDWLSSTRRGSAATKRTYADDLRRVWAPLARELGHEAFSVGCLTREHVRMWRLRQEAAGVASRSIGRYVACLSSLHVYAAGRMDPPPVNPVTQDDRPRVTAERTAGSTPVLEVDQVRAVAACASGELDLLVVLLLYSLAGRVTELCAADVTDLVRDGDRAALIVTRKGGKRRTMPLPHRCADLLRRHVGTRTRGPLLLDAKGDRLDRHDVDRITTRLGRAAGVLPGRDLTPHVWRASRITHMLDAGVPLAEVQEFADHVDPATTVGYWERRTKHQRATAHADQAAGIFDDLFPPDAPPGR